MKKINAVILALAVSLCIHAIGCSKKEATSDAAKTIKIGVVGPFQGPNAHIGKMIFNSVKLYFDNNTSSNFTVELVPLDDKSSPSDAVAMLQSTVADSKLVGLVAFYNSSTALAGKPIIQEAKLPTIIYSASNPKVTDDAPYYFRLVPTDDNQAVVLADYAKKLGANKIGILYYADDYGKGLADGVQARAKANGGEIVDVESYDDNTTDFRPILTIMKAKAPDVVMICGFVEKSVAILNQASEQGLRATFLCGDGTFNEEQLIKGAGANAEGVYVAAPYVFDLTNTKSKAFLDTYWGAYPGDGQHQKPASWSAFAYDAAAILDQAFKSGHQDRDSIYQFLHNMNTPEKGIEGVTGLTYFNAKGDAADRQFRLAIVKDKQFDAVK